MLDNSHVIEKKAVKQEHSNKKEMKCMEYKKQNGRCKSNNNNLCEKWAG